MKPKNDLNFEKIQQSASYRQLREIIQREVNYQIRPVKNSGAYWFAPLAFAEPGRTHTTNYSEFKKTQEEQNRVYVMKRQYKKEMKERFPNWKKRQSIKPEYLSINEKFTS